MRFLIRRRLIRSVILSVLTFFLLLLVLSSIGSNSDSNPNSILRSFQLPDISQYIFQASKSPLGSVGNSTDASLNQSKLLQLKNELNDKDSLINQRLRKEQEFKYLESQNIEAFNDLILNNLNEFTGNSNFGDLDESEILKQHDALEKQQEKFDKAMTKALAEQKKSIDKPGKDALVKYLGVSYVNKGKKPKACLLFVLHQHSEYTSVDHIIKTITELEKKFNFKFHYPYVFITEKELTLKEKESIETSITSDVNVHYSVIPDKFFQYPTWIDQNKAATARSKLHKAEFGSSESYRFIQRYLAGFIWKNEILADFDWYWRVEPESELLCEMQYDIFRWMQDTESVYAFISSEFTDKDSVDSIWKTTNKLWKDKPEFVVKNNLAKMLHGKDSGEYNLCQFASSFELGNLNYWRSPTYQSYFDFIDHEGGLFYERWTENVIKTIALNHQLAGNKIHFFQEIGLVHANRFNCPIDNFLWKDNNCNCDQGSDFTFNKNSCTAKYYDQRQIKKPDGWDQH